MADASLDAVAKALYERNAPVAPRWEDMGETTRNEWRESTRVRLLASLALAPARYEIDADLGVTVASPAGEWVRWVDIEQLFAERK